MRTLNQIQHDMHLQNLTSALDTYQRVLKLLLFFKWMPLRFQKWICRKYNTEDGLCQFNPELRFIMNDYIHCYNYYTTIPEWCCSGAEIRAAFEKRIELLERVIKDTVLTEIVGHQGYIGGIKEAHEDIILD